MERKKEQENFNNVDRLNLGHPVYGSIRRAHSFRRANKVAQLSHDWPCHDLAINNTGRASRSYVHWL